MAEIKVLFIGIDYDEFKTGKYHYVYVRDSKNKVQHFESGNPSKDYSLAIEYCKAQSDYKEDAKIPALYNERFGNVLLSSTIDNFIIDNKGKYELSEDFLTLNIIKKAKKEKVTYG